MDHFVANLNFIVQAFLMNLPFFLKFIAVFWLVYFINRYFFKGSLNILGIYPRHPFGLLGIVCAPFLHGNLNHLVVNSLMMLVLGMFVLLFGKTSFFVATIMIIIFSGLFTWGCARKALHIGASGLVMGYWGYLLIYAYYQPSLLAVAIVAVCLYYFSSMFGNLFPQDKSVSWEGHLFGFVAGIITVYLQPYVMPWFK